MLFENNLPLTNEAMMLGAMCHEEGSLIATVLDFMASFNLPSLETNQISSEINQLALQVSRFESGVRTQQEYQKLLSFAVQLIVNSEREDEVLEQLVPIWSQQRGVIFSKDKPIDEFYREVEYYALWYLLVQSATQRSFIPLNITKMRVIIRRYSNMPAFWYFLCQISGEELKTGYTF